jgi:F0F1-type ATP synthase assembly protein I
MRQIGLLTSIPIVLAVCPLVGFFLGKLLDNYFHTEPYLMTICTIFGFAAGGIEVYRLIQKASKED